MKINLNKNFVGLDGKEIPDNNMGKFLAQILSQSAKGDALKFWDWALKLMAAKELELDPSDLQTLKAFVENADIVVMAKAQLLSLLK